VAGLGPGITATTAVPSVLSQLAHDIEAYDHSTVGKIPAVGTIISEVLADASAFPTAAAALQSFRSELNYRPTDFIVDVLEHPSSYLSAIAAVMPTNAPFPDVVVLVSSIINEAEILATKDLAYNATATSGITTATHGTSGSGTIQTAMQTSATTPASGSSAATNPVATSGTGARATICVLVVCGAAAAGAFVVAMF